MAAAPDSGDKKKSQALSLSIAFSGQRSRCGEVLESATSRRAGRESTSCCRFIHVARLAFRPEPKTSTIRRKRNGSAH